MPLFFHRIQQKAFEGCFYGKETGWKFRCFAAASYKNQKQGQGRGAALRMSVHSGRNCCHVSADVPVCGGTQQFSAAFVGLFACGFIDRGNGFSSIGIFLRSSQPGKRIFLWFVLRNDTIPYSYDCSAARMAAESRNLQSDQVFYNTSLRSVGRQHRCQCRVIGCCDLL